MVISVRDLVKKYKDKCVLNNVSFDVENNQVFGILGKNGAGKSTIIGILTGFIIPTSGQVEVLDTKYQDINKIKRRIGVLPDIVNYYNSLTAYQHIQYFSNLKKLKYSEEKLEEILERVNLLDVAHKKVGKFSFGMKKRLGIAQAMLGEPEIIFLDEPTSGLDPQSTYDIQRIIKNISKYGQTVFIASNNLYEVERLCTKIAILDNGSLVCCGTFKELQEQYATDKSVVIYLKYDNENNFNTYVQDIRNFVKDIIVQDDKLIITIDEDDLIPKMVKLAVIHKVDVYKVQTPKLTLEQIYFHTGTSGGKDNKTTSST